MTFLTPDEYADSDSESSNKSVILTTDGEFPDKKPKDGNPKRARVPSLFTRVPSQVYPGSATLVTDSENLGKGDSVLAVAVENGATSNKGRGGNLVAIKQPHQPNLPAVHSAK